MQKKIDWIWFSNLRLRNGVKQYLLQKYKQPENIGKLKEKELLGIKKLNLKEITEITREKNIQALIQQKDYMEKNQIDMLTLLDVDYPPLLKQLYDRPVCLYYKGEKQILSQFCLAIIGCRQHTDYGAIVTSTIAQALGKRNITTVSGLARGIDSLAHRGSLQVKRKNNCRYGKWI